MTPEEAWNEILKLKQLLWLRHGCSVGILYGDDGEMQCAHCMLDFKRMTATEIEERFHQMAGQKFSIEVSFDDVTKSNPTIPSR